MTNKEEAIKHFEETNHCKWEEKEDQIRISKGKDVVYVLKPTYRIEVWGIQWFEPSTVEDLLSILHLYYMGK